MIASASLPPPTIRSCELDEGALRQRLGAAIVARRRQHGLKQIDLARRVGVTRQRLGQWERGSHGPPLTGLWRLAAALNVSLDELFTFNETELAGSPGVSAP